MGDKLLLILNILGTLYLVYFAGVIVLGLFRKNREFPAAAPQKRIAAVIAARNEAGVIGEAVRTLLAQDYPRELFDIWVIPNNCTDDTAVSYTHLRTLWDSRRRRSTCRRIQTCAVPARRGCPRTSF